jgi:hypothetical protein
MPDRSRKRARDPNQLAKFVADLATGQLEDIATLDGKNPAAVALGRLGGKRGGAARAASLSAKRRKEIAKKAATTRWAARTKKA